MAIEQWREKEFQPTLSGRSSLAAKAHAAARGTSLPSITRLTEGSSLQQPRTAHRRRERMTAFSKRLVFIEDTRSPACCQLA